MEVWDAVTFVRIVNNEAKCIVLARVGVTLFKDNFTFGPSIAYKK